MKIAVFGGTGGTGIEIISQALNKGIEVHALMRDPDKFGASHEKLTIIKGDVLNPEAAAEAIKGTDAVLSALGTKALGPTAFYAKSIGNIIQGMKQHEVKRILCVGAIGMEPGKDPNIPLSSVLIMKLVLKNVLADMYVMLQSLAKTELEWTMMLPPRLTDGNLVGSCRTEAEGAVHKGKAISRADLAYYMINHIEGSNHPQKIALAY
ncbi:MAG: NAD(P)H-binding protein [Spirochaetales bacterium]|jgi:biliverdin reductase / flavin reductase|nr:NAD(P)H-binding protein [Spirochaetales bacterium]